MMRELMEAAISGDVEILKRAVATKRSSLLCQLTAAGENIIHLAAWNGKVDFIKKAMEILSADEIQVLLSQPDVDNWNPLHVAVRPRQKTEILEPILGFCKSHPRLYDDDKNKPWLALNVKKQTPLHVAMDKSDMHSEDNSEDIEECAMKILSMDMEWLCGIEDGNGNSPLFLAVQMGYSRVAEKILMSSFDYSHRGQNGSTPLHFAPKCSENVLRLLLEKHSGLLDLVDDEGLNVLHQWAEMAELWPLNLLLEGKFPAAKTKVFKDLICQMTEKSRNENPLYIASVKVKNTEGVKMLVRGYQQETQKAGETQPESIDNPPWKAQNKFGNTCLHGALSVKHEELALYFLSLDSTFLCQTRNNEGESALFAAVAFGCGHVVEEILRTQEISFKMLRRNDGATILHGLQYIPVDISRKLLEKFWWINNLQDDNKKTALDVAKEAKNPSLLDLLMEPSLIKKESFNWITACEKEEKEAVLAFINNCDDLDAAWRERNDTILHHIRLQTYKEYLNFLKIPSIAELKNTTDFDGATPLHRALERQDMNLAKALLVDNEVEPDIPDHLDRTALNMLAELCKKYDDWDKMCKQIKINPHFKTTYIQTRTNMDQMRNTLSVVAALLATITFAAGFTLPGGLESETGNAVLAKKAAFLVFLISDAFAMCASMLVLFCLIWSMVSARDMAYLLVDRSVWILMQALNGTVVAFMTGVYVVIEHSSLWAAIIIFVMCSLIGILAYKPILLNVLAMFIPAADHDRKDRCQMLEEGRASDSRNDQSRNSTSYLETKSALEIVAGKAMEDEAHLRQKIQKVVLKLDIQDNDNWKQKAMKLVSSMPGVNSISMDMEEKKMTVLGYMDPVEVLTKLRKNYCTDIISVGQVPGKGTAEAEDDDHKKA